MSETDPREQIRQRSLTTVVEPTTLNLSVTPFNMRRMIGHLNQTVGMDGYEIVGYEHTQSDFVTAEFIVPTKDLAIILKLTYGGT